LILINKLVFLLKTSFFLKSPQYKLPVQLKKILNHFLLLKKISLFYQETLSSYSRKSIFLFMKPFLPSQETLSSISGKSLCLLKTHIVLFINLAIPSCLLSPLLLFPSRTFFILKKPSLPALDKPYPSVNLVFLPYSLFLFKKFSLPPQETLPFSSRNSAFSSRHSALLLKKLCPSPQETLHFSSRNSAVGCSDFYFFSHFEV